MWTKCSHSLTKIDCTGIADEELERVLNEILSPEHALLECEANLEINAIRATFTEKLAAEVPDWDLVQALNPLSKLRILINNREITWLLGKFTYEILRIFDDTPILVPAMPLDWLVSLPRSSTGGAGMVS
jgi:hypothetical protein